MSKNTLHKRRVKLFKKNKGNYWRVDFRSIRHMNQLVLAAKEAGYVPFDFRHLCVGACTLCMYENNEFSQYNHTCGISEANGTV